MLLRSRGAKLAPLLPQRLFAACFPPLRAALQAAPLNSPQRRATLRALAHCLANAPAAPLHAQAAAAVPILSQWLQAAAEPAVGSAPRGSAPPPELSGDVEVALRRLGLGLRLG